MNIIYFNQRYTKLPDGIKTAVLIACEPVKGENQTWGFVGYDTQHSREPGTGLWKSDKMDGDYLCLVLKSDSGAIFATLRKDNSENREKYMNGYMNNHAENGYKPYEFQIIIKEG